MAQSVLSAPHFQNEEAAFAFVEKRLWPDGPTCPHCGATSEHVGKLTGKTTRLGLHKCYACDGHFTIRMGTIFESSHLPLHLWLQVIHLMCASKKGISTRQIQRMLQCSMKTAWHLTHRIRAAMAPKDVVPLGGEGMVLEGDETFSLSLTNITGTAANLGVYTNATVTILDNDSVISVYTNAISVAEHSKAVTYIAPRRRGRSAM